MKRRIQLLIALSASVFFLGGCGTPLYVMTEEEEDAVVEYAAYTLAKHNIYQKDGMTDAVLTEEESESQEPESTEEPKEDTQTSTGETGASVAENGTEDSQAGQISLAAAIGHEDNLEVTCDGYKVADTYKEGSYLALNPDMGKKLVVMNFIVKNPGKKAVKLDMVSLGASYYASINGEGKIAETTFFGSKSLSSFDGKIKAGKSEKLVLLFQIPEENAKNISSTGLYVTMDGVTYSVTI
ncbi:MAG: hypothetical protein PUF65_01670 [Lachnospiraceae bacterium]|nr:hypothetical protein [Lachnospiraceae bacterium]